MQDNHDEDALKRKMRGKLRGKRPYLQLEASGEKPNKLIKGSNPPGKQVEKLES